LHVLVGRHEQHRTLLDDPRDAQDGLVLAVVKLARLENVARPEQMVFVLRFKAYTYVVPFVIDSKGNFVLKTVFPSRKFHRLYAQEKR